MDGEAVVKVAELAEQAIGTVHHEDDVAYSAVPYTQIRAERKDEPDLLCLQTLEGLVDYLEANVDALEPEGVMIHVSGPSLVRVISKLHGRDTAQRSTVVAAAAADLTESFLGRWMDLETALIGLETRFQQNSGRAMAVRILGNVTEDAEVQTEDDGISQTVSQRAGFTLSDREGVPNPVALQPYRTFHEVEQPESPFLLRLRRGREVEASFWLADGGRWELEAVENVAAWIESHTADLGFPVIM